MNVHPSTPFIHEVQVTAGGAATLLSGRSCARAAHGCNLVKTHEHDRHPKADQNDLSLRCCTLHRREYIRRHWEP